MEFLQSKNIFVFLFLTLIITINLSFVIPEASTKLFYGDEIVFAQCAKSVLEKGVPLIEVGKTHEAESCLWHPPIYIYLISLMIKLFGNFPFALRLTSILFNLFSIVLLFFITREVLKENDKRDIFALMASLIYSIIPLTLQGVNLLDIDSGILPFFFMFFIYLYIKKVNYFYLLISLLLIFWSKFSGVIILFISLILFQILNKKYKELIKILNGIKTVALKQRTMIDKWKDANEGWKENENLQNKLTSLVFNSMTLIEQDKKEMNKIIPLK